MKSEESNRQQINVFCPIQNTFGFYKDIVFPAEAKYSYFPADFRLKIFLFYRMYSAN